MAQVIASGFKTKKRFLFSLFLLSGAGLIFAVYFDLPLAIFLLLQLAALFFFFVVVYHKRDLQNRKLLLKIVRTGLLAGILATAGYDGIRWLIVSIFHFTIRPFDTFKFFGQMILNPAVDPALAYTVGFFYHLVNGITFGIAYFILFNGRHWLYGVAWAFVLEVLMLCVYPKFLNMQSVLQEFTIVSCSGHFVYGIILGLINQYKFNK